MRRETILNRVEKHQSFVYGSSQLEDGASGLALVVRRRPRRNGGAGCGDHGPTYDHLAERRFEYPLLWGIAMFFAYRMRRVNCVRCGVIVERVPWCDGKHSLTTRYRWFLAKWAQRLSWSAVASIFGTACAGLWSTRWTGA